MSQIFVTVQHYRGSLGWIPILKQQSFRLQHSWKEHLSQSYKVKAILSHINPLTIISHVNIFPRAPLVGMTVHCIIPSIPKDRMQIYHVLPFSQLLDGSTSHNILFKTAPFLQCTIECHDSSWYVFHSPPMLGGQTPQITPLRILPYEYQLIYSWLHPHWNQKVADDTWWITKKYD